MNLYRFIKVICLIVDLFFIGAFSVIIVTKAYDELLDIVLIMSVCIAILCLVQSVLIIYYRSLVKTIDFSSSNVIIETYHKKYTLPSEYFTEVNEDVGIGRTIIKYDDGKKKRVFIFPMISIFPSKIKHLDIYEMKRHMPHTKFK